MMINRFTDHASKLLERNEKREESLRESKISNDQVYEEIKRLQELLNSNFRFSSGGLGENDVKKLIIDYISNNPSGSSTYTVKTTSGDLIHNYLREKLEQGSGVLLELVNQGMNEKIRISSNVSDQNLFKYHGVLVNNDGSFNSTPTISNVTRQLSIDANETYWYKGEQRTLSAGNIVQVPSQSGIMYFVCINSDTSVSAYSSVPNLYDVVPLFRAYDTGDPSVGIMLFEERHRHDYDVPSHYQAHYTEGTYVVGRPTLNSYELKPESPSNSGLSYSLASCWAGDEDILVNVESIASSGSKQILFKNNSAWTYTSGNQYGFQYTSAGIQYCEFSGTGNFITVSDGNFVNYYVTVLMLSNNTKRYFVVPGSKQFNDASLAITVDPYTDCKIQDFDLYEYEILYKITYKVDYSYTSIGKCRIEDASWVGAGRAHYDGNLTAVSPVWESVDGLGQSYSVNSSLDNWMNTQSIINRYGYATWQNGGIQNIGNYRNLIPMGTINAVAGVLQIHRLVNETGATINSGFNITARIHFIEQTVTGQTERTYIDVTSIYTGPAWNHNQTSDTSYIHKWNVPETILPLPLLSNTNYGISITILTTNAKKAYGNVNMVLRGRA